MILDFSFLGDDRFGEIDFRLGVCDFFLGLYGDGDLRSGVSDFLFGVGDLFRDRIGLSDDLLRERLCSLSRRDLLSRDDGLELGIIAIASSMKSSAEIPTSKISLSSLSVKYSSVSGLSVELSSELNFFLRNGLGLFGLFIVGDLSVFLSGFRTGFGGSGLELE